MWVRVHDEFGEAAHEKNTQFERAILPVVSWPDVKDTGASEG